MVRRPRSTQLLLRGYGPLLLLLVAFSLVAVAAPPLDPEAAGHPDRTSGGGGIGEESAATDPTIDEPSALDVDADAHEADAETNGDPRAADGSGDEDPRERDPALPTESTTGAPVEPCADRELQLPGDPYSPACVRFEGTNPGVTARGVTRDEIILSVRIPDEPGFQDELANISGAEIADSPEDVRRTVLGLVDYFNERFEFYGRRIVPEFYLAQGSPTEELLGGGHEEAQADAITVAEEIGAFAELNAGTEPYAAALAELGVINFGAPFVSREWFAQRRPYSWSLATDCSIVAESIAHWANVRIEAQPTAEYARGDFRGQPRRIGLVTPENPFYQECVDAGMEIFEAEAPEEVEIVANLSYALDLGTMSNQAANLVARLQDERVTSVLCNCDPVMPVFLTARATEQDYWPEWNISGVGFTDQDLIGQLFDQEQWARAYGISYVGETLPQQASLGYHAYRQERDDEPAFVVDVLYYNLYLLSLGIQGAGPDLTPTSFEQGMFDYRGGSGPAGTWGFGPDNYTPTEDFREIYWDPDEISPFHNEPGAYIDPNPGQRYRFGELPPGPPNVPW